MLLGFISHLTGVLKNLGFKEDEKEEEEEEEMVAGLILCTWSEKSQFLS